MRHTVIFTEYQRDISGMDLLFRHMSRFLALLSKTERLVSWTTVLFTVASSRVSWFVLMDIEHEKKSIEGILL